MLCFFLKQEWSDCENPSYNVIILNDRLMSETVQSEHSYFNNTSNVTNNLDEDDISNDANLSDTHTSSFKGEYHAFFNTLFLFSLTFPSLTF